MLTVDRVASRVPERPLAEQRIVRGIISLAADTGIRTVAEGVEDAGALALLGSYGVDYAQGYHIARPGPIVTGRGGSRPRGRA